MAIKIGFSKTIVNGIRGRTIRSIKALDKAQLPEEYLEQRGAIYREELKDGAVQCLRIGLAQTQVTLLATGMWFPETKFALKLAAILKAGNLLREVNKRLANEWAGEEFITITADGKKEEVSTSLLMIRLRTSKVYKDKQKYRKLHGVVVTVDHTVLSKQVCNQANERVLNVLDKFQFFFKPVTEREFQHGIIKLKRMVHKFEHRFWRGKGAVII